MSGASQSSTVIVAGDWACAGATVPKTVRAYFFFAAAFTAGLAGAFAFAFFLSFP